MTGNLIQCIPIDHIPATIILPHLLKPHLIQQHPHLGSAELRLQLQVDNPEYIRYAIHLIRLARLGDTEVLAYLVFL